MTTFLSIKQSQAGKTDFALKKQYTVCLCLSEKLPRRSFHYRQRHWDKEQQESLSRAGGVVSQKALPCPHWTPESEPSIYNFTKRDGGLTKAFSSAGDTSVIPRQLFNLLKGLKGKPVKGDCSEL